MSLNESRDNSASDSERYVRQSRFAPIGESGQSAIGRGRALICGCGALGSVIANTLVRAGVGFIRLVDRDFLEWNNLQRQVLFDEQDVRDNLPKAIAARNRLGKINSGVTIEPIVTNVDHANVRQLVDGVDVIVDGTDNFETRFLLNDIAHETGTPWIYGGCVGAEGQSLTILPGETPCFRCVVPDAPPAGTTPSCDTAGVIAPIVNVIASIQSAEALKILCGARKDVNPHLTVVDLWTNQLRTVNLDNLKSAGGCPTCSKSEYPWLNGERTSQAAVLCGRNSVQLATANSNSLSLESLERKLAESGTVTRNPFLLRAEIEDYTITIFKDGRAVIGGTSDPSRARTVYARYVGN